MIWRNLAVPLAPSIMALSYNSSGMPCMPASKMTVFRPRARARRW